MVFRFGKEFLEIKQIHILISIFNKSMPIFIHTLEDFIAQVNAIKIHNSIAHQMNCLLLFNQEYSTREKKSKRKKSFFYDERSRV